MPNPAHDRSQELSSQASLLMQRGQVEEARQLYLQATSFESEALAQIAPEKPRTRGILAVSLVSQYYKATAYKDAEKTAYKLLSENSLPEFAREQLRELLSVIWEEQLLQDVSPHYPEETNKEIEIRGTLRALHLDRDWLEVALKNGSRQRIHIAHEILDDVVGPMVNQAVLVRGLKVSGTGEVRLIDIELDSSADAD